MSSYRRIIIYIFVLFFTLGCSPVIQPKHKEVLQAKINYKTFAQENRYIMFALEYDKQGFKENSRKLYLELYKNTLKEEYLLMYIRNSFSLKKYEDVISIVEDNRNKIVKDKTKIEKVYILSLIHNKNHEKALIEVNRLLEKDKSDENYSLLGNIYLQKGEYKKSKVLFEQIYKNTSTQRSLINLVDVMYAYLDEKKEAIDLLESYTKINGCENLVCSKLLSYYQEEKNIDGIISVLKKSYYTFKDSNNPSLEKVYKLLMYYLVKKDVKDAISFLEESNADDDKLLVLYRNNEQYEKAYNLANKLYEKSSNIDYLAQIAILEFEKTKDKKEVLFSVIKKFEDVLTVLDNHIYQNYLGYILIDFDVDIKKGLNYVNQALKKAPNNFAYLDSLAWGQYKLNDCKNAYINMKKVVDGAGLNDEEIRIHWNKIKECGK